MFRPWRAAAGCLLPWVAKPRRRSPLWLSCTTAAYHTIEAVPRELRGRVYDEKERRFGRTPAAVLPYQIRKKEAKGENPIVSSGLRKEHLLTVETQQIASIMKTVHLESFCCTLFRLDIRAGPGSCLLIVSGTVIPIELRRDRQTGQILNLKFKWVDEGSKLKVKVPVVLEGEDECPGLNKGGRLKMLRRSLRYLCPADKIPSQIKVDISNLDISGRVGVDQIMVHPSLVLLEKPVAMPICEIANPEPGSLDPEVIVTKIEGTETRMEQPS